MEPHIHISAINGLIVVLYAIVGFGALNVICRKFEGNRFADALLEFVC
jgi:hypothetical protein